jgi:two-component system nitrate/nitrite response regulator NarL
MRIPLVVTHPCTLLHGGLRRTFDKSQFGPLLMSPQLGEKLERRMQSLERCIWLVGVTRYDSTVSALLRGVTIAAPGVKAVILAAYHAPDDVGAALKAGACGFLCQDISAEPLLNSLELVADGQTVVPRDCQLSQVTSWPANVEATKYGVLRTKGIEVRCSTSTAADSSGERSNSDLTQSLSRRELLILRMLIEGASNKVIALKLVITESTVKVHMKAILRKLRLQNRTQAAMWARNHVNEKVWMSLSRPHAPLGSGLETGPMSWNGHECPRT